MSRSASLLVACVLAAALGVAACGDDNDDSAGGQSADKGKGSCSASVGLIMPITGPVPELGAEELNFGRLGIDDYNAEHGTDFKVIEGDTQAAPAQATTVTQQFASNDDVVALVSGITSGEITAIGPHLTRANLPVVASGTTKEDLTNGDIPTFFRLAAKNSLQASTVVDYIDTEIGAKKVMVIDDQSAFSVDLSDAVQSDLEDAGIAVQRESITANETDFSALVSKTGDDVDVAYVPWTVAGNAQQFGKNLEEQGRDIVLVGGDGLFSPGQFTIAGSYVAAFAPDIKALEDNAKAAEVAKQAEAKYGKFGTFGPPVYVASQVVASAIDRVCEAGEKPSRENVLEEIKKTDEPDSILGQPIKFTESGDLRGAEFFLFKINEKGDYELVTSS